jgi:CCR4-NOT transcription complex subunit 7/8
MTTKSNTMTQAAAADGSLTGVTPEGDILRVREVWDDNLDEEMALIRDIVDDFPFLAMDTEFPGVVARPVGHFRNAGEYHYQTLRLNVDMLKLIQLGLTFSDAEGNLPRINNELCVWQFNFREFCLAEDMYAGDSIELLKQSGIDFAQIEYRGIDVRRFGEQLTVSGVVLNEDVRWITFHAGYDFGYLLKVLTAAPLPEDETEFFELLKLFFPTLYDIKYLMKFCNNLHGGLNKLAETLDVERIGPQHQAGSDSLLTCATFLKLAETSFNGLGSMDAHLGVLYGLGSDGMHELIKTED